MKNYRFKVKKIITNEIDLKAKNYKEALTRLIKYIDVLGDDEVFSEKENCKIDYDIILDKITDKNDLKDIENIKEILSKFEEFDEENEEKNPIEIDENDEDFDEEFTEIICDNCGNCIVLDDDFMS